MQVEVLKDAATGLFGFNIHPETSKVDPFTSEFIFDTPSSAESYADLYLSLVGLTRRASLGELSVCAESRPVEA